jgi:glycerate dehydrogenase
MKIVILDGDTVGADARESSRFAEFGEVTVYDRTPDGLAAKRIGGAEFALTDGTKIDRETLDRCPNLKWIGVLGTGYDSVDVKYARGKGIPVCNVPGYATQSVAEHSFALLFHLCHHLSTYSEEVPAGRRSASFRDYSILKLRGKTIGIFGFGDIAKASVKIAEALDMNVLISTRHPDPSFETGGVRFAGKDEIYETADVISLHCPLRDDNAGFINRDSIAKMKNGVILINTARGALVNEQDLADALKSGKVAGAGLDVLAAEPAAPGNPLMGLKNCVITPHIGWYSKEAKARLIEITVNNLRSFLSGELLNCVN